MKSSRVRLTVFAVAGGLAAVGIFLLVTADRQQPARAEVTEAAATLVRVPPLTVTRRVVRDRIEITGVIKPIRSVDLAAEVDGKVASLGAREHEPVRAGQEIVRLDDKIRKAAVERAEAAVVRTRSLHHLAKLDLDRQQRLSKQGVASAAELDRAISEERASFGALGEAEATLAEARELLARTIIGAPFDGILSDFDLEVGDRLRTGGRVGEVIDLSRVEIEIGVTDREVVSLRPADPVAFELGVYPSRRFTGEIRSIGSALDPAMHKFPVEVVADNADGLLLPGMVARVSIEAGAGQPVMRIPRQATREEFGLTYVYVLETEGGRSVARRRRVIVRPVAFRPAELEIAQGLEPGERIATGNLRDLAEGMKVSVED